MKNFKQWLEDTGRVITTSQAPYDKKGAKRKYSQKEVETEEENINTNVDKLFGKDKEK